MIRRQLDSKPHWCIGVHIHQCHCLLLTKFWPNEYFITVFFTHNLHVIGQVMLIELIIQLLYRVLIALSRQAGKAISMPPIAVLAGLLVTVGFAMSHSVVQVTGTDWVEPVTYADWQWQIGPLQVSEISCV